MPMTRASNRSKKHVWIAHSIEDREPARAIAKDLDKRGVRAFLVENYVKPGDDISLAIGRAMMKADAVVVLLSAKSVRNPNVLDELALALYLEQMQDGARVLPVLIDRHAKLPFSLRDRQVLDLTDPERRGVALQRLVRAVEDERPSPRSQAEVLSDMLRAERARQQEIPVHSSQGESRLSVVAALLAGGTAILGAISILLLSDGWLKSAVTVFLGAALGIIASSLWARARPPTSDRETPPPLEPAEVS